MRTVNKILLGGATLAGVAIGYLAFLRPRLNRWGATNREVEMTLPGDELVPRGAERITHVVDIEADVEEVWPWLKQIGQGRGGFYSYAWIENLLGSNIENANQIKAPLQDLEEGEMISLHPDAPPLQVVNLDPPYNVVLYATDVVSLGRSLRIDKFVWSFHVRPHGRGSSRLIARVRATRESGALPFLSSLVLESGHFILERKMMLSIKALAERAQSQSKRPVLAGRNA